MDSGCQLRTAKNRRKNTKIYFSSLFPLPSSLFLLPSSFTLGNWLSRISFILDYGNSPDDLVGGSLVAEFGDRTFLLGFHHPLGSRISRRLGMAICNSQFSVFTGKRGAGGGNSKFSALIRVLIGTALWCALESLWSSTPLWWTSLSYTQSPHNLAILHLGQLSGPSAVTASIIAVNGLIAEAYLEGRRQKEEGRKKNLMAYLLPASLCLILHIIGWSLYNRPPSDSRSRRYGLGGRLWTAR